MADPRHAPIQARVEGVREVLAAASTSVPDAWDVQVPGTQIEDGITAADRVLALPTRPSALFVSTDRIAIGITHRLLARGVRVPEDIALVSYDDIPYAMPPRSAHHGGRPQTLAGGEGGQSPVSAVRRQGIRETTPDSFAPGIDGARLLSVR